MNNMPLTLKKELENDPEYSKRYCIFHNTDHSSYVKNEWHHNLIFAGKQVQKRFAILSICQAIHEKANEREIRERLNWIMLNRASEEELTHYSKVVDQRRILANLNEKYGLWQPRKKSLSSTH